MTTTSRPELKPALDRHGRQMSADGGAAKNELRPMKECTGCGNRVAFVQNKAGKWYLANCYRYANQSHDGAYYYRKDSVHKCAPVAATADTPAARLRADIVAAEVRVRGLMGERFSAAAREIITMCDTLTNMADASDDDRGLATRLGNALRSMI